MTEDQRKYAELAKAGALGDILTWLTHEARRKRVQSYCGVDDGFLAWGRKIIPTDQNRLQVKAEYRCTDFGTDNMAGMLEWVGRQVSARYRDPAFNGVHLLIGDVSAPRGGCMAGKGGRRGHRSHTSGEDADMGYLNARARISSPNTFSRVFDPQDNWWLVKKIFQNPFACVKVIFLDRRHINSLRKVAGSDPDWKTYGRYIRHIPGHRNHMHVRIGEGPGLPGCVQSQDEPVQIDDEDSDSVEETEAGPERWTAE